MEILSIRVATIAAFVALFVQSTSCKPRTESLLATIDDYPGAVTFQKEVIPFNRVPMDRMKADEETYRTKGWHFPPRTEVQMHDGKIHGIRVIDPKDLNVFIRPGDIAVDYSVISNLHLTKFESKLHGIEEKAQYGNGKPTEDYDYDYMLIMLGEQGMSHAKMVIEDKGKICHVDSPADMSDCEWHGNQHFFRVETSEENSKKAAIMAKNIITNANGEARIGYDSLLLTDIYAKGFSSIDQEIKKALEDEKAPLSTMYCSELPFVFHSVVAGKPIFTHGYNLIEFAEQIMALKSVPELSTFVSDENMQKNLIAFIQQASTVNEEIRPMLTTGVRQLFSDGMAGSSLRYLAKQFYPSVIFPKNYMIAAKDPRALPGSRVVYIGSIEAKEPRRDAPYYSTMLASVSETVYKSYLERVHNWWNGKKSDIKVEGNSDEDDADGSDDGS